MRSFKGILALVFGVVLLTPVVSHAASLTIDGVSNGFSCGIGTQTCALPSGTYNHYDVVGSSTSFQSNDGTSTDTLKLTSFKITPHDPAFTSGNAVISISQDYGGGFTSTSGTYTFGDYAGGYFTNNPATTLATSDSITMNGSGVSNTTVNLATLSATVSSSNFYSKSSPLATSDCTIGSELTFCSETLAQTITIHFIGRDTITVTNSFFLGASIDGSLPDLITTEANNDLASFPGNPVVPEPTSILLLGTGLASIFAFGRKRLLTRT